MSGRRLAWLSLAAFSVAGLLAPLLCNDVPLAAQTGSGLRFPAFAGWGGVAPAPPSGASWKDWWALAGEGEWALMPPWPFGPNEVSADVLAPPSLRHPLGTDDTGRDLLARLVHGTSTSLVVAAGTIALAAVLGIPLGALAGYYAFGLVDAIVLRAIEVFLCFPALFLALSAVALLGGSPLTLVLVLGVVYWTHFARIVRGEFLALREREFVLAARNLGLSAWRIATRHMLPQIRGAILVVAAFLGAGAMVVESSLSFLGLGPGLQVPSLGSMLAQGKEHAHLGAWHLWLFPGLALTWAVLCLHVIADRDGPAAARAAGAE